MPGFEEAGRILAKRGKRLLLEGFQSSQQRIISYQSAARSHTYRLMPFIIHSILNDFMDADLEAWHHISTFHLRYGTTQLVPTTLAADREGLLAALDAYMACGEGFEDGAGFLGIHVEGPGNR